MTKTFERQLFSSRWPRPSCHAASRNRSRFWATALNFAFSSAFATLHTFHTHTGTYTGTDRLHSVASAIRNSAKIDESIACRRSLEKRADTLPPELWPARQPLTHWQLLHLCCSTAAALLCNWRAEAALVRRKFSNDLRKFQKNKEYKRKEEKREERVCVSLCVCVYVYVWANFVNGANSSGRRGAMWHDRRKRRHQMRFSGRPKRMQKESQNVCLNLKWWKVTDSTEGGQDSMSEREESIRKSEGEGQSQQDEDERAEELIRG